MDCPQPLYPDETQSSICDNCLIVIWKKTPKMDSDPHSPYPKLPGLVISSQTELRHRAGAHQKGHLIRMVIPEIRGSNPAGPRGYVLCVSAKRRKASGNRMRRGVGARFLISIHEGADARKSPLRLRARTMDALAPFTLI